MLLGTHNVSSFHFRYSFLVFIPDIPICNKNFKVPTVNYNITTVLPENVDAIFPDLVWDFCAWIFLAVSHLNRAVLGPGAVGRDDESQKMSKYASMLATTNNFIQNAVETIGAAILYRS